MVEPKIVVDWSTLIIIGEPKEDGEANGIAMRTGFLKQRASKKLMQVHILLKFPFLTFLHTLQKR
jgi:hypothetical protein